MSLCSAQKHTMKCNRAAVTKMSIIKFGQYLQKINCIQSLLKDNRLTGVCQLKFDNDTLSFVRIRIN